MRIAHSRQQLYTLLKPITITRHLQPLPPLHPSHHKQANPRTFSTTQANMAPLALTDMPTLTTLYTNGSLWPAPSDTPPHHAANASHNSRISLIRHDITQLQVSAIVNAANVRLLSPLHLIPLCPNTQAFLISNARTPSSAAAASTAQSTPPPVGASSKNAPSSTAAILAMRRLQKGTSYRRSMLFMLWGLCTQARSGGAGRRKRRGC